MRITLLTDAPLNEVRHPRGTSFTVVDKLPGKLGKGEVDTRTADAWRRLGWAEDETSASRQTKASKPDAG